MSKVSSASRTVPSLPQTLVNVLDASSSTDANVEALSAAILKDVGVAARVLSAANSAFFSRGAPCRTIDNALLNLGLDTVRSLALTAAIQQLFGRYRLRNSEYLREIWWRALTTAHMSQVLATLTLYPRPEEAYIAGLLIDLGRLTRLVEDESNYWPLLEGAVDDHDLLRQEASRYGHSHPDLAADQLEASGLGLWIADAVRYHLAPAEHVQDAHHLVKLVNAAYAVSPEYGAGEGAVTEAGLGAAYSLLGLNEGLTRELCGRIHKDVAVIAGSLGIEFNGVSGEDTDRKSREWSAEALLGERVRDLTELDRLSRELSGTDSLYACCRAVRRSLFLTLGVKQSLVFLRDAGGSSLSLWLEDAESPDFTLPLLPDRSLVADTLLDRQTRCRERAAGGTVSVVDQQLFRLCKSEILWTFPLIGPDEESIGVLLLGFDQSHLEALERRKEHLNALSREIARALSLVLQASTSVSDLGVSHQAIREILHEAGNPLSIIQNYVGVLRMKLNEDHMARRELDLIRDEIDRVGRILLRLREPTADDVSAPTDLNAVVRHVAEIVEGSLGAAHGVRLQLQLTPMQPVIDVPGDHLRQILTNLLKNAVEAMDDGGEIFIRTEGATKPHGRPMATLCIVDEGPGIPADVLEAGFAPVRTTKGEGHSGLGLSIVKRLADEVGARIDVESSEKGTRFEIRLPCVSDN